MIAKQKNFRLISNMLSQDFLSLMSCSDVMVGNSSAGIREAPSFSLPVINIGSRQNGRLRAKNVIDVSHDSSEINDAISFALNDSNFINSLKLMDNPYGNGNSAKKIVDVLENIRLDKNLIQKEIAYDL